MLQSICQSCQGAMCLLQRIGEIFAIHWLCLRALSQAPSGVETVADGSEAQDLATSKSHLTRAEGPVPHLAPAVSTAQETTARGSYQTHDPPLSPPPTPEILPSPSHWWFGLPALEAPVPSHSACILSLPRTTNHTHPWSVLTMPRPLPTSAHPCTRPRQDHPCHPIRLHHSPCCYLPSQSVGLLPSL